MEIRTTHIEAFRWLKKCVRAYVQIDSWLGQGSSYLDEHFFRFGQNRLEALPVGEHFPALNFHVEGFFEERPGHCPREDPRHVGMDLRVGLHLRQDRIPRVEQASSCVLASTREWNKLRWSIISTSISSIYPSDYFNALYITSTYLSFRSSAFFCLKASTKFCKSSECCSWILDNSWVKSETGNKREKENFFLIKFTTSRTYMYVPPRFCFIFEIITRNEEIKIRA